MPDYKLISDEPCGECDGAGARLNGRHCTACRGTGRLLVSIESAAVQQVLASARALTERVAALLGPKTPAPQAEEPTP